MPPPTPPIKYLPKSVIPIKGYNSKATIQKFCHTGWQYLPPRDPSSHCGSYITPGLDHHNDPECLLDPNAPQCLSVLGGYTCRLDDVPAANVCPGDTVLRRVTTRYYQCMTLGDEIPPAMRSCIPGFNLQPMNYWNYLLCVADGADFKTEASSKYGCSDPKATRVGAMFVEGGLIREVCCAYLKSPLVTYPKAVILKSK